ncbi:hypothetical protein LCGC14_0366720 [marine sediment metagenome]|uniref:GGDEF domain-containing protein n=1 Tax=marine sediment metagenome TaxID=412755 RepID=A0A0F9T6H1_9ZZZZ|nr:diguanylate cyclase [Phycisphaerae bacterium]HDZ43175.1 diguanylate cyclase [Phycisphaerae bacterium]
MFDRRPDKIGRILIVSPHLETLASHVDQMARTGWSVTALGDEVEALAAVRARSIDLVVLHVPATAPTDARLIASFRQVYGGGLPVMVLAHHPDGPCRCYYLDKGADDVICESTSLEELISRVRALLRFKQLHDDLDSSRAELADAVQRERSLLADLRRHNEHLQSLVTTDPLTHVASVRSFHQMLTHEFKTAKRYNKPISLLMLDVDHFKVVNDCYGHPSGDYVLKELAVVLTTCVRESDVVARVGGEEFAVILPQADTKRASRIAERIRHDIRGRKFQVFGRRIHVTASIGLATWPNNAEITEHGMLVYFADQALLRAKDAGRDRVVSVKGLEADVRARMQRNYAQWSVTSGQEATAVSSYHAGAWREPPAGDEL